MRGEGHPFAPSNTLLGGDAMRREGKVEISGVTTSEIEVLSEEEKRRLLLLAHSGDALARERLILGNLRLVLSIVGRFSGRGENPDDLFQVGCIGLIKAIDHFNTELDVRFSTYAVPMIIGEMRRYLRDNSSIRVSRSVRDLAYRALRTREEISRRLGREASTAETAGELGIPEREVSAALEAITQPVSLYDSVFSDGDDSVYVIDQLSDSEVSDEIWIENIALKEAIARLGERERAIIKMRFYRGKTQMEIAGEIGISQAQVSRLEKSAIDAIRRNM